MPLSSKKWVDIRRRPRAKKRKVNKAVPLLLGLSVLGLIVSVLLVRIHFQISVDPESKSFCHISPFLDCDAFVASPYAQLGPFLISELNIGFYFLVLWGVFEAWNLKNRLPVLCFLFICVILFVVYETALVCLSVTKLGVLCPLCLTSNFINLGILVLIPFAMETRLRDLFATILHKFLLSPKSLSYCLIAGFLFFGVGLVFARRLDPNARYSFGFSSDDYLKSFYESAQETIFMPERPYRGNPDAKVTIVQISDFQCRPCRQVQATLNPIVKQYGDRIRLVFLNYPFNNDCNPAVRSRKYSMTCLASQAALCAYQQGKFWEFYDRLFQNQATGSYAQLAGDLGMDSNSVENCMNSKETESLLREDIEAAIKLKVEKIPVFYINGRLFTDWRDGKRFRLVVESELSRTTSATSSTEPAQR